MLLLFHFLLFAFCIVQCVIAVASLRDRLLRFLLFAGIGLIHGLVPAIAPHVYYNLSHDARLEAALYALCGSLLLAVGWQLFETRFPSDRRCEVDTIHRTKSDCMQRRLERLFWLAAIIGALAWPAHVYATGASFSELAEESRFAFRGSGNVILAWGASVWMNLAFLPGFLCFFLRRKYRTTGIIYALFYAVAYYLVTKGTRAFPIGLLGTILCGYALSKRQTSWQLANVGLKGTAIIFLAVGLLPLRWQMSNLTPRQMMAVLFSWDTYEDMLVRDPLNYHENLAAVVSCFPDRHDFVYGASYRRILFFYLPHSSFPELKPRDPNRIVAEMVLDADPNSDWMHPPSLFGDCYINFCGWKGIVLLVGHGVFFAWLSRTIRRNMLAFVVLGPNLVYLVLLGLRGQPYTVAVYTLTMCVAVGILFKLLGISISSKGQERPSNRRISSTKYAEMVLPPNCQPTRKLERLATPSKG